jgi:hypothetical protein
MGLEPEIGSVTELSLEDLTREVSASMQQWKHEIEPAPTATAAPAQKQADLSSRNGQNLVSLQQVSVTSIQK